MLLISPSLTKGNIRLKKSHKKQPMKKYLIIDDSGVDYNFLAAFGYSDQSWKGQIVIGNPAPNLYAGAVVVEKPFGISGTWTTEIECLKEI